jgi:hypothetical protein
MTPARFPEEVVDDCLQLIHWGLIRARSCGGSGDSRGAAIEADHVHTLPGVLRSSSVGGLAHYLDRKRGLYQAEAKEHGLPILPELSELWCRLDGFLATRSRAERGEL